MIYFSRFEEYDRILKTHKSTTPEPPHTFSAYANQLAKHIKCLADLRTKFTQIHNLKDTQVSNILQEIDQYQKQAQSASDSIKMRPEKEEQEEDTRAEEEEVGEEEEVEDAEEAEEAEEVEEAEGEEEDQKEEEHPENQEEQKEKQAGTGKDNIEVSGGPEVPPNIKASKPTKPKSKLKTRMEEMEDHMKTLPFIAKYDVGIVLRDEHMLSDLKSACQDNEAQAVALLKSMEFIPTVTPSKNEITPKLSPEEDFNKVFLSEEVKLPAFKGYPGAFYLTICGGENKRAEDGTNNMQSSENQRAMYCIHPAYFLAYTFNITDIPIYGYATSGPYVVFCAAWYSSSQKVSVIDFNLYTDTEHIHLLYVGYQSDSK